MLRRRCLNVFVLVVVAGAVPNVMGQIDPVSGIDFVTVGAVGNSAYFGRLGGVTGRGQVNYEYRIGRLEVTTAQWAEFMNAALDRPATDRIPHVFAPTVWGASNAPAQNGGQRWRVSPGRELIPTSGVDWRTCAIYCNWLHNGKSTERSAFLSGAYEASTFGYFNGSDLFTDQITRSPGAQYWIPSLDEWVKAAHYDPSKQNSDGTTGGYWKFGNRSDSEFVLGPPGQIVGGELATANTGWREDRFPGSDPFRVPLGAYAHTLSPWGLLDVAGGTSEWLEETFIIPGEPLPRERELEGSSRYFFSFAGDEVGVVQNSGWPTQFDEEFGFRIAASVPTPGVWLSVVTVSLFTLGKRRR